MPSHYHFITGKLAEPLLREVIESLRTKRDVLFTVEILPISVAALLTTQWIAQRWSPPQGPANVILPGYVRGELSLLETSRPDLQITRGPKDLRDLPDFITGVKQTGPANGYGEWNIEIIAEINHADRFSRYDLLGHAERLKADGADVIDLGCTPGEIWQGVEDAVRSLRDEGFRISIDSMDDCEIASAVRGGAELVLSVNQSNCHAAVDWGVEVVAIPDDPTTGAGLERTLEFLTAKRVPFRIDPILQPIGFGFAESLVKYREARFKYPSAPMMMGIGNLTELTDVDSAGVNLMLLALCQEWDIRSVLTTQVIHWAQTSVGECDIARQLVHFACTRQSLPKHLDERLVMLRGGKPRAFGETALLALAKSIKDRNVRLFAEGGQLHALAEGKKWTSADAFGLFDQLVQGIQHKLTASHAFYLGYELAKANIAMALGKEYRQDEALDWGMLTKPEESHLARRIAQGESHDA